MTPGGPHPRLDVEFPSQGVTCRAWHFPAVAAERAPCVVLAHGLGGVREQRLDRYAERFAAAGLAALVFDYRHFGASAGEPRQLYDIRRQLQDWRAAVAFARTLEGVDPGRIALWGTSTSGGHVLKLAAEPALGIWAVVAQMPFTSGTAQFRMLPITQGLRLLAAGASDQLRAWLGRRPRPIPAAGRPYTLAVVTTPDALSGLARVTPPETTWRNEMLARFTLTTALYHPGRAARRMTCPLLVCIADGDRLMAEKPALKAGAHGTVRRYGVGHFGMYDGDGFERAVRDQVRFLRDVQQRRPAVTP